MNCRHCGHDKVNRPRGLCWTCYHDTEIRQLYAIAIYGYGADNKNPKPPTTPTTHSAGTIQRIMVYAERAKNGEQLWHPDDSRSIALRGEQGIGKDSLKKLWKNEMNDAMTSTLSKVIGGPPTEAFKVVWAALQVCTEAELTYLLNGGIQAIQTCRDEKVVPKSSQRLKR